MIIDGDRIQSHEKLEKSDMVDGANISVFDEKRRKKAKKSDIGTILVVKRTRCPFLYYVFFLENSTGSFLGCSMDLGGGHLTSGISAFLGKTHV